MELAWVVYFINLCDSLTGLLIFFAILAAIGCIVGTIATIGGLCDNSPTSARIGKRLLWIAGPLFFLFSLTATALPSSKTSYMMLAAYATQTMAQSTQANEVGTKLLAIVNQKLDEMSAKDKKDK